MNQKILHTPEGVRDIYQEACQQRLGVQNTIQQLIRRYGYADIETPTFEYFDVFSQEVGTTPSKELYKFFDRDGHTLVLRPDITPSIARASAKYFTAEELPLRLCYQGNTFINHTSYQGRLRETTHLGAEMIGDNSADADAEMIVMVINSLREAGLKEFQISIGQVNFLRSLIDQAGITPEQEEVLRQLITNKNHFGVEKMLSELQIDNRLKELFVQLPHLYGGCEILDKAEMMTDHPDTLISLKRLQDIYEILKMYDLTAYVSFDLGMYSHYMYYSGIIFRAYTFGSGDAIVKGGRYDGLLGHFGKDAPAIGFVVVVDQLLVAMQRQKITVPVPEAPLVLRYRAANRAAAIREANELRQQGKCVALLREEGED